MGSAPRVFFEQSTPVTVNSNLPSRAGWLSPTVSAASDDESPRPEADDDEESPPPDVVMAMITRRATMASKIHSPSPLPFFSGAVSYCCGGRLVAWLMSAP
jgi:hypothetical protein